MVDHLVLMLELGTHSPSSSSTLPKSSRLARREKLNAVQQSARYCYRLQLQQLGFLLNQQPFGSLKRAI